MRLEWYDYSMEGAYFITICTLSRDLLFDFKPASDMVESYWNKIAIKFSDVSFDEFVIMPNHIHGILIVGADPCVGPSTLQTVPSSCLADLPRMVQWFKTMTTNAYLNGIKRDNWRPFNGKLWQRGYYERIIRGEEEMNALRKYIIENPKNWDKDEENIR